MVRICEISAQRRQDTFRLGEGTFILTLDTFLHDEHARIFELIFSKSAFSSTIRMSTQIALQSLEYWCNKAYKLKCAHFYDCRLWWNAPSLLFWKKLCMNSSNLKCIWVFYLKRFVVFRECITSFLTKETQNTIIRLISLSHPVHLRNCGTDNNIYQILLGKILESCISSRSWKSPFNQGFERTTPNLQFDHNKFLGLTRTFTCSERFLEVKLTVHRLTLVKDLRNGLH